jgi:hypothetical protein
MFSVKHARVRAGILAAVSAVSLGALGAFPASAAAGTAQSAQRTALQEAMALTPALPPGLPAGTQLIKHNCVVIHRNSDATLESVVCADLWFLNDFGLSEVWAGNEVYCQNLAGNLADCSHPAIGFIQEEAQLFSTIFPTRSQTGLCGQAKGHSDCGTRRVENITQEDEQGEDGDTCVSTALATATVEMSDGVVASGSAITGSFTHSC